MSWTTIGRPGYFGKKRDKIFKEYNEKYGENGWKIAWKWGKRIINFIDACLIYEDGYYHDSFEREDIWEPLKIIARDVYDIEEKDVESKLDYTIQKGPATHLQDISIRKVFFRRGWEFEGTKLIRIRPVQGKWDYWAENLVPGRVDFHLPEMIENPRIIGWWDANSIEDFYQSNKILQIHGN